MNDSVSAPRTALEHFRWRLALLFVGLVARPALERAVGPHAKLAQLVAATLEPHAPPTAVFDVEGLTFAVGLPCGPVVRLRGTDGRYGTPIRDRWGLPAAMREAGLKPWEW